MNNIFEGAKLGQMFVSRDGRKFCFLGKIKSMFGKKHAYQLLEDGGELMSYYNDRGKSLYCEYSGSAMNASDVEFSQVNFKDDSGDDIVSRHFDRTDDGVLKRIAAEYCDHDGYDGLSMDKLVSDGDKLTWGDIVESIERAYIAGYRNGESK